MAVLLLLLSLASIGMTTRVEASISVESLDVVEHYVNSSGTAAKVKCCCREPTFGQGCGKSVKVERVKPSEISPQSSYDFVCCERVERSKTWSHCNQGSESLEKLARKWQASGQKPMGKVWRDVVSERWIAGRKSWIQPSPSELDKPEDEEARTKEEANKRSRFLYDVVELLHGRAMEWVPRVSVSEFDCSEGSPVTYSMIWVDVPNFREAYGRHYSYKIPADIAVLVTAIRSKPGFPHKNGIIREPGDKVQVNLLQGKIAAGTITMKDLVDADTSTLSSALKERFREMPLRLLDFMPAITEPWHDVIEQPGKWEVALSMLSQESATDLINRIPEPIHTVTMYVLDFLLQLAGGGNDETAESIAVAVAPSLLSDSARMERAYETNDMEILKLAPDCQKRKGVLFTRLLEAWRKHNEQKILTHGISTLRNIEKQVQLLETKYSRSSKVFNRANNMALGVEKLALRPKCEKIMRFFGPLAEQLKLNVRRLSFGGNDFLLKVKESCDLQTAVAENMLSLQNSLDACTNLITKSLAEATGQSRLAASREKLEQLLNPR